MSIFTRLRFASLLIFSILGIYDTSSVLAQSSVSIIDISPSTSNVSEQTPPAPARISLFAWQGTANTEYTIRFSVTEEPALVVGVGTEITTTSFDSNTDILTVVSKYNSEKILTDDNVTLPENIFMIALDPGVDGSVLPSSTTRSQSCYGPGANPKLYDDSSSDFGDDDSLNDPESPSDTITTVGLPHEAAGTFASTNSFYWCVVPPKGSTQGVGMRLLGKKNASARLSLSLSPGLLDFMGDRLSRTLTASNLGIYSDELQVGAEVDQSSDGAEISATFPLDSDSTKINIGTSSSSRAKRTAIRVERATVSASLEQRTISIGVKEALTLSPDSLKVVGKKVQFAGFVDDLSLVGESVEIIRIGGNQKCGIGINAIKGTVIARGKILANGSYNVQIPASAVFNDKSKKSKLVARIPGEAVKTSREISLSNRNRDLRQ